MTSNRTVQQEPSQPYYLIDPSLGGTIFLTNRLRIGPSSHLIRARLGCVPVEHSIASSNQPPILPNWILLNTKSLEPHARASLVVTSDEHLIACQAESCTLCIATFQPLYGECLDRLTASSAYILFTQASLDNHECICPKALQILINHLLDIIMHPARSNLSCIHPKRIF